jgi:hypothetical protein
LAATLGRGWRPARPWPDELTVQGRWRQAARKKLVDFGCVHVRMPTATALAGQVCLASYSTRHWIWPSSGRSGVTPEMSQVHAGRPWQPFTNTHQQHQQHQHQHQQHQQHHTWITSFVAGWAVAMPRASLTNNERFVSSLPYRKMGDLECGSTSRLAA